MGAASAPVPAAQECAEETINFFFLLKLSNRISGLAGPAGRVTAAAVIPVRGNLRDLFVDCLLFRTQCWGQKHRIWVGLHRKPKDPCWTYCLPNSTSWQHQTCCLPNSTPLQHQTHSFLNTPLQHQPTEASLPAAPSATRWHLDTAHPTQRGAP